MSKKLNLRNERLVNDIAEGKLTYSEIGEIYGVTKQRVQQFASKNNIFRWKESRETKRKLKEDIKTDIINGLTYEEINEKYSYKTLALSTVIGMKLKSTLLEKRNKEIVNLYKQMTAKEALNIPISALDNPYRIHDQNMVYKISAQMGYKKYSAVGDRSKGGCFEKKEVIRLIRKLRNKGMSFRKISDRLNEKGIKTIQGKEYTSANLQRVYHATLKK